MTTERTTEPGWQAGLFAWIVLTYTVGGAIAWWRRPDNRFGPLMVAAGAAMFVSSLYFADSAALFALGQAFDLIPAALFLLPATMTLLGERNWYLPRWLRWLPRPPAEALPEATATAAGALLSLSGTPRSG